MQRRQFLTKLARLAALAPVALLASCGGLQAPGTPLRRPPTAIRLAYGPSFSDAIDSGDHAQLPPLIDAFRQAHPDITVDAVEATSFQGYQQRFLDAASGSHADVIVTRTWGGNTPVETRLFAPLESLLKRDRDVSLDGFYPQAVHRLTVQGHLIGLPRDIQPALVIFYNVDLFREAGVATPSDGWSSDEFLQTADQIAHAFAGKPDRALHFPLAVTDPVDVLYNFILSQGGRPIDASTGSISLDDDVIASIQFYADLYHTHHVLATNAERAGAYTSTTPLPDFIQGKVPMLTMSMDLVAFLRTAKQRPAWDVATMPSKASVKQAWPPDGSTVALTKASTQQDSAWTLAKYLANGPGMQRRAQVGDLHPADKKLAASSAWLNQQPPDHRSIFNTVGMDRLLDPDPLTALQAQPTATPATTINYHAMFRSMASNIDDLTTGKMPARQFAQESASAANAPLLGR